MRMGAANLVLLLVRLLLLSRSGVVFVLNLDIFVAALELFFFHFYFIGLKRTFPRCLALG